jgi:dolichol-phosphate mannosyltransferase
MPETTLLAIPVFNEARYVCDVVRGAQHYVPDVLVVDDGSTDETPVLLREIPGLHVITHAENRGYGKSLADAFCFAIRRGYSWLITMDCDEQHEVQQIPRFLEAVAQDDADIISGTRYPDGFDADLLAPSDRREINRQITAMLNARLGLRLTDAFCGFKAYRVAALKQLCVTVPGYAMPMQFWVQVAQHGQRVREIPVRLIYNDPTRHFGGMLDDPEARLRHYLDVFEAECARAASQPPCPSSCR